MWGDIDKVLVAENERLPVDWNALAPSGRVFAEIGFGSGEFLAYLAAAYPDALIVGVEVSQLCVSKGIRLALSRGLENVRIMHGDARFLLRRCFAPESVERVYMNYPCPWPKQRHAQRRVTVPAFTELLKRALAPGGYFELTTDVGWYALDAAENIAKDAVFAVEPIAENPARPFSTKYERKWKAMGKDIWTLRANKTAPAGVTECEEDGFPMEEDIKNAKSVRALLAELKGTEGPGAGGKGHWVFRECFISGEGTGLVSVITADEGFEQHFYLKLIEKRDGVTVKVDSAGHPYRTPAMRAALAHVLKIAR